MRRITILGATGSVGQSTLDVIKAHPDRFQVEALTAARNVERLAADAKAFGAKLAVVSEESAYGALKEALSGSGIEAAAGPQALIDAASRPCDLLMAAIVGAAGLAPTLAAIRHGTTVAVANKEVLVCAGELVMAAAREHGAKLLPVDSEHNAIFQVFEESQRDAIDRLILTASGGPFRTWTLEAMKPVTPAQAVAHPNWSMGAKISVDSATMMNKGLELIEACHLFAMPADQIEVLVHPQSVIHSLVGYKDGSVLAQLGSPDMRTPIAYALGWPERISAPVKKLNLYEVAQLTFEAPDPVRFPALRLTREALSAGGAMTTVLNAANEIAVAAFLEGRIGFLDIAAIDEAVMGTMTGAKAGSLDDIAYIDGEARRQALARVDGKVF
ncbi:1-deoxy-D-xylulose-5-phosphate reductoisomerase [Lacibacterium aquatile]|uniref:1-deoxy-D-xylulose 5-phosphate reductoisomerase n=1 Tax=Lacibacterium aquatile TaxID=1168082 RepID=A0ABW5DKJ9_9PROT